MGVFGRVKEGFRKMMLSPYAEDSSYREDEYYEDDGYYDDRYDDEEPEQVQIHSKQESSRKATGRTGSSRSSSKIVDFYNDGSAANRPSESIISHPQDINDAVEICNHVRAGRMVIVDLSGLDPVNAQRIADYLGGVCHSLDGDTKRVNNGIFTVAPKNHRVTSDYREEGGAFDPRGFPKASSDR